jgi:tetratricopeptide (TPR) repeat protein
MSAFVGTSLRPVTEQEPEPLAAPPYVTGGGGIVLEHRYGATLLAALLTGDPVAALGADAVPLLVRFQASAYSPVDDLLLVGHTQDGGKRRVSIGVRRAPQLTASDEASVALLASYLRVVTESWEEVHAGRWRLALAVASPNPAARQVRELAVIAKAEGTEAGFRMEVRRPGRTSRAVRKRLSHLDVLVRMAFEDAKVSSSEASPGELTWRLLSSLQIPELRLEGADVTDRVTAVSQLRAVALDGSAASATGLFSRLVDLANEYAPAGAEVTESVLRRDLSGTPLARSPSRQLAKAIGSGPWPSYSAYSLLDPPYQPMPLGAPEAWLLQPRFGVVPYLGRGNLLANLEAWCAEDRPFSIGVIAGEGGSGKSRLAAELCGVMRARDWEAGLLSRTEALTDFTPESPTLVVVDYPEQRLAVLGPVLEQLASRMAGPHVRVLLLGRQPTARSHWWADLDRTSHRTATGFTRLQCDLSEHVLSLAERRKHAEAAVRAFGRYFGVDEVGVVPDVADDEFANPLLVHVAALLAVHGQRSEPDSSRSVREDVLAHLLDREQSRWARLRAMHQLADLHETHALRAVLAAVLTGPSAGEVADLLAALPEFSGPAQRERRGRIGYWLVELYPGEPLLASFGPDLLVEELLDIAAASAAGLDEVIAAVHNHGTTSARHRSRLLATLQLAAERRPAVHSALHGYLAANLAVLVQQALDDPDGHLATTLESALVFCGERKDPELRLAFACVQLQADIPDYHERGAQLLCTTMRLALPVFQAMAEIDLAEGLDVLVVGLFQLIHRYEQAGWDEEALALSLECVQARRQLVDRDRARNLAELSFDLGNLAVAHMKLGQHQEALAAAEEAVALQRELAEGGKEEAETRLAIVLHRLGGIQAELGWYDEALAANTEALPVLRRLAERDEAYYLPVLAEALGTRGAVLTGRHQNEEGLAVIAEVVELRERLAEQRPDRYLPSLLYDLHNVSRAKEGLGRYEDALADAARAVEVSRRLTAANPRRHRTMLIRNLDRLAQLHLRLAQPGDAVAAIDEAVALGRQGTEADLALSLAQLIDMLVKLDQHPDALLVCQEAVALLQRLAESQPRWLPQLVSMLIDLSQVLDGLDRLDEALDAAHEAMDLAQRLDAAGRLTLARALVNLGDRYARLEHISEALEHTREGVELLRPDGQPAALVPALAKLADRHARLDHRGEALAAALDAVQLGEAVRQTDPTNYRADFAYALHVLSDIHLSFGRPENGLQPLMRAVRLHEELVEADPGRYRPGLAAALHSLANIQVATGRNDKAVTSCRQGNGIYEQLAGADEDRYMGRFAASLRQLRAHLVSAGQLGNALPVARQQVEAVRRLVTKNRKFRELLVQSYDELAKMLILIGDIAEARRITALAEMHERLAAEERSDAE